MKMIPFFMRRRPKIGIEERPEAALPSPVMDPNKTMDPKTQVLPVKILAIEESRVGDKLGYRWTIPNDTMEAVKLLKIIEMEINRRILDTMSPTKSKIHRV